MARKSANPANPRKSEKVGKDAIEAKDGEEPQVGKGAKNRQSMRAARRRTSSPIQRIAGSSGADAFLRSEPTVSLCMIVRDEERVLDGCLTSVKPFFDEIIVVDTGSTDRTVAIAEEHGARVAHFPWCDDFSAARNVSLSLATAEWVCWMDADDTLPEHCGARIKELLRIAEDRTSGFIMQVHIPPKPGEYGFTIVDHVKLFRNRPEHRFTGRIHEQILESIHQVGGLIERTDLYVVHSGYDHSPEGQRKKRERDLRILEKELAERPDHPFVWFNVGMTHFHLRDFPEAVHALERCLALSSPNESTVRKVYAMLASACFELGDHSTSIRYLQEGLARFPNDTELLFRAGGIYRDLGDPIRAEASYQRLLTARETGHIDSLDVTMAGFKAYHNLALVYQDMGRLAEAEQWWRRAVQEFPGFVPSLTALADLFTRTGRVAETHAVVRQIAEISPTDAEELWRRIPA